MTPFLSAVTSVKPDFTPIRLADHSLVKSSHKGIQRLPFDKSKGVKTLVVPTLHEPLLSISGLCDVNHTVVFTSTGCYIYPARDIQILATPVGVGYRKGGLYYLPSESALNLSNGFCTSTVSPHLQWMRFRSDNAQSACNVRWPVRLLSCGDRIAHPPPCWNLRCNRLPDSSSLFCFRTVFSQASVSVLLVHMLCLFLCYFLILVSFLTPVSFCSLLPCLDSIHSNSFSLNTEPLCLLLSLITPLDLEFSSSTIHYWLNCPISKNSHGHSLFTFQVLSITSYEGWFLLESCLTSRNPSFSFSTSNMFGLIINNPVSSCYTTFPVRKTSILKIIVPPVFQIETFQTFIWAVSANQLRGRRCARKV